jgi:hypothetical protein
MAIRKKSPNREAQLGFESLSIEGGLLSPQWLSKVAQLAAGAQAESDYRIEKGLNLRDEIGRHWRMAQSHWSTFVAGRAGSADARLIAERFVQDLLLKGFGFVSITQTEPVVIDERSYPIGFSTLAGRVPIVIAPAGVGLDTLSPAFGDSGRRRSAFGLTQEYLNAADGSLWGLACDGVTLRILRDNASLTRPAWIEADLGRMFSEERYADFAALWLLAHETRFGRADQPVSDCALEVWRSAGREEGTRAREHLRRGVEDALLALGQGFVAHPENQALRASLQSGELTTKAYFNQLLRLVYRLIFLITVEERGLLHPDGVDEKAKALYSAGYSMRRLRERSVKRSAHDKFSDLWEATKIALRGLANGEPRLGLPALAGIFAKSQCPHLDAARVENRSLLLAVFKLCWLRESSGLSRVNWRDMGPEELGSVYESLLELVPQITQDGRAFSFASGAETKGNARKTSGSYYTPESLVQVLIDSALEPVIADTIAKNPANTVDALLGLSIVDPACGSGHFLLAAARRLAAHVARLQASGTLSAAEYRHALRQVVGRCLYGVDLNPMAVELCKVSLWMEAVEPGLPLTFLNSHIQHGNALLGTTPELMAKGIPDAAWEPIEGDDKRAASVLKKRNNKHANEQQLAWSFVSGGVSDETARVKTAIGELESATDESPEGLAKKESQWEGILRSTEYRHQKLVADAWCAAFVWPKQAGESSDAAPTNEVWRQMRDGVGKTSLTTAKTVNEVAEGYNIFHWHLQFPHVFAKGGFDVVLGNPPWERLKLQTDEWMTAAGIDLTQASNASTRNMLLERLLGEDPRLRKRWTHDRRVADGLDQLVRGTGRFPFTAAGDMNSYAIFAELGVSLLASSGRGSWVLPIGIVSDKTYAGLCANLMEENRLQSVYGFVNEKQLFADVMHNFKFVAFSVGPGRRRQQAVFVFGILQPSELRAAIAERGYELRSEDVEALNPDTRTCPVFIDAGMAKALIALHRRLPSFVTSGWNARPQAMLHMGVASRHFVSTKTRSAPVPVYESKMVHRYNHRFGSFGNLERGERSHMLPRSTPEQLMDAEYEVLPGYFCPEAAVKDLGGPPVDWLLVFRRIANPALARTGAFCFLPRVGVGDSLSIVVPQEDASAGQWARDASVICWLGNSAVFDAVLKQKMGGNNFSEYVWRQLPVPSRQMLDAVPAWFDKNLVDGFVIPRVCELSVTSHSVLSLCVDLGFQGSPFRWDANRRRIAEAELDAAAAMAFGLTESAFSDLFDAFPVLKARELENDGEFTTRSMAIAVYRLMAEATRTGKAYQTRLDPPPADSSVAHSTRGTNVISLPTRSSKPEPVSVPAPIPLPAAVALPQIATDGSWQLPPQKVDTAALFALASVIVVSGKPLMAWRARLFAALSIDKQKALDVLPTSAHRAWKKAVGRDSKAKWDPSALDKAVDDAVSVLRGRGDIDLSSDGTFVATSKLASNPPNQIYVGRAAFIIEHVAPALNDKQLGKLKTLFPVSMQDAPVIAIPA